MNTDKKLQSIEKKADELQEKIEKVKALSKYL